VGEKKKEMHGRSQLLIIKSNKRILMERKYIGGGKI
jgi:hypothetical protein